MDFKFHFIFLLFSVLGNIYASDFFVVAPTSLRLNSEENIVIISDDLRRPVEVYIQDHPGKLRNISRKLLAVESGKPKIVKIRLDPNDFPPGFLNSTGSPKLVSLNAQFGNAYKDVLIPIEMSSGYVFIQTDKPIYTPRERISLRIISLDENSRPSKQPLRIQLKNPDDIIVEQRDLKHNEGIKRDSDFRSEIFHFPSFPVFGEWSVSVYYGHNFTQNSAVHFELQEYVLPFFTVELETPDIILPYEERINIKVSAKYSYGRKVKGFVSFRIGVKKITGEIIYLRTRSPDELIDGAFDLNLEFMSIMEGTKIKWFPEDGRLYVKAIVVDSATGNEENAISTKTVFTSSPFDISFKRCLKDFKPGFTSLVEADVTYKNGQPAAGISMIVSALADNGKLLNIVNNRARTDKNGKVSFEIQPEISHKTITITLETAGEWRSLGTVVQEASSNETYVMIARNNPQRLKPDDMFGRRIEFEPPGIRHIYFLVIARGRVLIADKLPEGQYKNQRVTFRITHEMVPNFRILIFAHHGRKLLADSLKIDVENICHPDSEVTIDPLFVTKEPGYNGKIIITGTKGTSVGLMGIDEAVYSLSKKDILTNTKVFNRLASHDLGCGPGGGKTIDTILGNAGIIMATNEYTSSHSHSCSERIRRRREVFVEMANNYTGFEKQCCQLGMEFDPKYRDCEERKAIVDDYLTEGEYLNCSEVFLECCEYMQLYHPVVSSLNISAKSPEDSLTMFLDVDEEEEQESKQIVRRDFFQTWFFQDVTIGLDNRKELEVTLPGSITTWVIQAVSLSPSHGVCVAEPKKLESTKKVFLHLNLPYSVIRNEQVDIQAIVFNYAPVSVAVSVSMYGEKDLCSGIQPGKKGKKSKIVVDPLSSATVIFPVIPLKANVIPIKVVMVSEFISDIVQKDLHVVPEGVTKEIDIPVNLDPRNYQKREESIIAKPPYLNDKLDPTQNLQVTIVKLFTPENFVPGTESCSIKAVGNIYGPAVETSINDPDRLLIEPTGCGEQNMLKLAPTLYTMRYLKISGRLTAAIEEKGYDYLRKGYANQLKYRKEDGSYAAFPDRATSTWLTAFVIKVFCQASELIYIDQGVLCSGVKWLIDHQQPDGSFEENYPLYSPDLMGGLEGRPAMTAFVLITLKECKCGQNELYFAKHRAASYLQNHLEDLRSPLSAAIIAYALALNDDESKHVANDRLLTLAIFKRGCNWLYWPTQNSVDDIQTSAYALLTQLLLNDMDRSTSIVNWLNTQRLDSGAFRSTQDTVIALQAMSEYVIRAQMPSLNLVTNISSSNDALFHTTLLFSDQNVDVVQNIKISRVGGTLFIKTSGNGVGSLSVKLRYNVNVPPEDLCKFDIKINVTNKRNAAILSGVRNELHNGPTGTKSKDKLIYNIELCVRYFGNRDAQMSIVDVGIFSGFEPNQEDLLKIVNDRSQLIQRYEEVPRGVIFYLEKIPTSYDYCFSFHVTRKFIVRNTQMSVIKVYDYYNPNERCTKFYKPESNSPLLRTLCEDGICQCAEGGCPPQNPFSENRHMRRDSRRDLMLKSFCDEYDYVWLGRLNEDIKNHGGFKNISFLVEEVIKPGIEKTENVQGQTRTLLALDFCANLHVGVQYLILGQDGQMYMNENGVEWYRYLLDQSSVVYMWTHERDAEDCELQRDLNYVCRILKQNGCGD